jgi:hypothetical protein
VVRAGTLPGASGPATSVEQQRYFLHRIVLHAFAQKPLRIPTEILEHNQPFSLERRFLFVADARELTFI